MPEPRLSTMPDKPAAAIAPEGQLIVVLFVLSAAVLVVLSYFGLGARAAQGVGLVTGLLCVWCVWFFRDPSRMIPAGPGIAVSPADGVICAIDTAPPPPELGLPAAVTAGMRRVSVFMNVFDVHVNRSPLAGRVAAMHYREGLFVNASLDKASEGNERNSLVLETPEAGTIVVVQIAGLVARRIVSRVAVGAELDRGDRFGIIRFGSRVDVFFPSSAAIEVAMGQRVHAGESVLARIPVPLARQEQQPACSSS